MTLNEKLSFFLCETICMGGSSCYHPPQKVIFRGGQCHHMPLEMHFWEGGDAITRP